MFQLGACCLSLCTTEETDSVCPFEGFPSPCWTNLAPSLYLYIICYNPLTISLATSGLIPVCWSIVDHKSGHSASGAFSYPSVYCPHSCSYNSVWSGLPFLPRNTTVSCPVCSPPGLQALFLTTTVVFVCHLVPNCPAAWGCSIPGTGLSLMRFFSVLVSSLLSYHCTAAALPSSVLIMSPHFGIVCRV